MPVYNLTEYSDNYSKTSGRLWQYFEDVPAVDNNNNNAIVNFAENDLTDSFNCKAKMTGQTGNNGTKNVEIMVPLKYLSNFWRTLEILAFENDTQITSAKGCYLPNVELKNYNVVIHWKNLFDQPVKDNKVTYENIRKIATGRGDDYTAGCLLDYPYFKDS